MIVWFRVDRRPPGDCSSNQFKMAGSEDLTPEQTEKLLQFQDLTGIEEMNACRSILEQHNWDIEVAVQARLSEQEGTSSAFTDVQRVPRMPLVNAHPSDQRVFTIARRYPQSIIEWGYFIILFPFRFLYSTLSDILRFAYRLLRPDPRRYVTDPLGDVLGFIRRFEEAYGTQHPNFFRGTYSMALNEAKQELRFLLVYLHGDDHQDTSDFCRNTLCNPAVVTYIDNHLLFWACNTNSPEGYRVSQALRENTYPFLALIVLRQNKMTVVAHIEGLIEPNDLIRRLTRTMEDNEASLVAARIERQERNFNQILREEQDAAYLESLRADQEKERKKREEREAREKEEQAKRDQELAQQQELENRRRKKEELRNQIPPEPDADDPNAIRIVLKLPNGIRLERRFLRTDSLKHLYHYVFVHEAAPDDFQIVTNFPRRVLNCQPTNSAPEPSSFEESGLGKSEMLFVHDNEA